jgi:hypothetical protein
MYQPIEPVRPASIGPGILKGTGYYVGQPLAPMGARIGAGLIDFAILVGLTVYANSDGTPMVSWAWLVLTHALLALMPWFFSGYTPGKLMCGLQIVHPTKDAEGPIFVRPGIVRLTARWALHPLDLLPFMWGYLGINAREHYQTYADSITEVMVIRRRGRLEKYDVLRLPPS